MRSSALYTCATLKRSYCSKGYNSTSVPPSINTKSLCLRRPPFLQPVDIPSISQTRTLKEKKINIIKDLLHK